MKPDYKNWVPKNMVIGFWSGTAVSAGVTAFFAAAGFVVGAVWAKAVFGVFLAVTVVLAVVATFMQTWHNAFSYTGKRKLSKDVVEGTAKFVTVPENGTCLDVGCGSGALSIAVAKRNENAKIVGVDRWGKEYASFSLALCESNALAEGVKNTSFEKGDATKLPFEDETFDAVTSNYVYHNIPSKDRQAILLETLRVLKKGGTFALHDLFTKQKYGDMEAFVKKLRENGYEKVELIDTTKGLFMTEKEAKRLFLQGSAILVGKK